MGIVIGGVAMAQVTVIPLTAYMASLYGWPVTDEEFYHVNNQK